MSACSECGHQHQAGARFCSVCGTAVGNATAHRGEERKVVTVVFR